MMEGLEKITQYLYGRFKPDRIVDLGCGVKRFGEIVEHFKKHKPAYMWMCRHFCVYERSVG